MHIWGQKATKLEIYTMHAKRSYLLLYDNIGRESVDKHLWPQIRGLPKCT